MHENNKKYRLKVLRVVMNSMELQKRLFFYTVSKNLGKTADQKDFLYLSPLTIVSGKCILFYINTI